MRDYDGCLHDILFTSALSVYILSLINFFSPVLSQKAALSDERAAFTISTIVIVAGIIGGTIVLAVAVIVCGVVYIQKFK